VKDVQRLSAEERRQAIVVAAMPLFARKGFAQTTTKDLAKAAGVSEALIFKHFPSKDSLYAEIQDCGCRGKDPALDKLADLEPSTSTLVHLIYYLMRVFAFGRPGEQEEWETRHRLVVNSCLEDGQFARMVFQNRFGCIFKKLEACYDAATAAGDVVKSPVSKENQFRFAHHLAAAIAMMHLPDKPAIDYHASKEDLLNQAVWFVLQGFGLTDRAIATYFNPKALSLFFGLSKG
jgi:AcrR family transcriptional regulator